jgi:hypothetical protein
MDASRPTPLARFGWLLFVALACAHFAILYLWRSPQFLDLRLFAQGGERVPYQTRILMAWVLAHTAASPHLGPILARLATHLPKEFHDPYILVLVLTSFLSMFVAVVAARATLLHLTGSRRFASWAALLTLYMAYFNLIDVYGLTYSLPYDATSLAFFSIAVWLVLTQRFWLLLPIFALGTLNRETFCFLTIFLALYAWFSPNRTAAIRRAAPHLALQTLLWIALRLWMRHKFLLNPHDSAHSPSGLFDIQVTHNIISLLKPPQWPLFLGLFGFTLPLFIHSYRWIPDRALARAVATLLPLWFAAMMIVGVIVEVRIFDELTAFLVPCIALILWTRWVHPASYSISIPPVRGTTSVVP